MSSTQAIGSTADPGKTDDEDRDDEDRDDEDYPKNLRPCNATLRSLCDRTFIVEFKTSRRSLETARRQ